jgi:hypothetical protein
MKGNESNYIKLTLGKEEREKQKNPMIIKAKVHARDFILQPRRIRIDSRTIKRGAQNSKRDYLVPLYVDYMHLH